MHQNTRNKANSSTKGSSIIHHRTGTHLHTWTSVVKHTLLRSRSERTDTIIKHAPEILTPYAQHCSDAWKEHIRAFHFAMKPYRRCMWTGVPNLVRSQRIQSVGANEAVPKVYPHRTRLCCVFATSGYTNHAQRRIIHCTWLVEPVVLQSYVLHLFLIYGEARGAPIEAAV